MTRLRAVAVLACVVSVIVACQSESTTLRTIDEELKLYSDDAAFAEGFNGATCLVSVDIPREGDAAWRAQPAPWQLFTQAQVDQAGIAKMRAEIAKCPADAKIKLQLMYHCNLHSLPGAAADSKGWNQQATTKAMISDLASQSDSRVTKVYLASCGSNSQEDVIALAGTIPGIEYVISVDTTILLAPGNLQGVEYPNPIPTPVKVTVWDKDGDKLVAHKPIECDEDQKFDIATNRCVSR